MRRFGAEKLMNFAYFMSGGLCSQKLGRGEVSNKKVSNAVRMHNLNGAAAPVHIALAVCCMQQVKLKCINSVSSVNDASSKIA